MRDFLKSLISVPFNLYESIIKQSTNNHWITEINIYTRTNLCQQNLVLITWLKRRQQQKASTFLASISDLLLLYYNLWLIATFSVFRVAAGPSTAADEIWITHRSTRSGGVRMVVSFSRKFPLERRLWKIFKKRSKTWNKWLIWGERICRGFEKGNGFDGTRINFRGPNEKVPEVRRYNNISFSRSFSR